MNKKKRKEREMEKDNEASYWDRIRLDGENNIKKPRYVF